MRFATIEVAGKSMPVGVHPDGFVDFAALLGRSARDIGEVLADGWFDDACECVSSARADLLATDFAWRPPVLRPSHVYCAGVNYDSHRAEAGIDRNSYPTIFMRSWTSQVGHLEPIVKPTASEMLDFEGELALVIGKGGRHIAVADAMDHVAGVSCYNDASVRDFQRHSSQWTPGKNFVGTGAFGRELVTTDEVDWDAAVLSTLVNGTEMQRAPLRDMVFSSSELIAYISSFSELLPGDVILTGTPAGVGMHRKPPIYLYPGDVVEISVTGVTTLVNRVEAENHPIDNRLSGDGSLVSPGI